MKRVDNPSFGLALAEHWRAQSEPLPFADGGRFRHSWAGACSRKLSYFLRDGVPDDADEDDPFFISTGLGKLVHEAWQEAMATRHSTFVAEHKGKIIDRSETLSSCHADGRITGPGYTTAIELKFVGERDFHSAVGFRCAEQGPKWSHVVQACLNAVALDADEAVLVYLSHKPISRARARLAKWPQDQRATAQWVATRGETQVTADRELARWRRIAELVDGGDLAPRAIPDGPGMWTTLDHPSWQDYPLCEYCPVFEVCDADARKEEQIP